MKVMGERTGSANCSGLYFVTPRPVSTSFHPHRRERRSPTYPSWGNLMDTTRQTNKSPFAVLIYGCRLHPLLKKKN